MKEIEVLRELFDKKILNILSILAEHQHVALSLTEIAQKSSVSPATTLRILDRLESKGFVEIVTTGKSKSYKLIKGEKGSAISALLKKDQHINEFVQKIRDHTTIQRIILEERTENQAKFLMVGTFSSSEKLKAIVDDIRRKFNFKITFLELSEKQYEEMENLGIFNLSKKIIWERN